MGDVCACRPLTRRGQAELKATVHNIYLNTLCHGIIFVSAFFVKGYFYLAMTPPNLPEYPTILHDGWAQELLKH